MKIHSYLSPKCITKTSKIHRNGVFAKEEIKKDELIMIWGGYILSKKEVSRLPKYLNDFPVQIFENLYLGPKSQKDLDDCEMINHSCDPNAGVKGQIILVARRGIKKGEEISFDYETTDTQELNFVCNCGAKNCRQIIDGDAWKDPAFQRKNRGFLSHYLTEKIEKKKK